MERICLEGSRRQAKYAVHALAAVTKDDGLMSLSVLYKVLPTSIAQHLLINSTFIDYQVVTCSWLTVQRLLDMLNEKKHLPAVLQSLGCIAEIAMPVFETRESEITTFIKKEILEQSHVCIPNFQIIVIILMVPCKQNLINNIIAADSGGQSKRKLG